ncbi:RagB/SusD family nutrient uptake outer membrane protein [Chitinophaga sp. Cy-1792]|uniref:RagB/SusD family nutrient uptake outer membrane protein n=1 Tax=Chitinophaga sp. Cy-1792 TaxID=2608339 RepID=UPI0014248EC7|nr:RagB/SusD family nutrient uptake outer membrane protein [Chitinophaga sp. Cy-1792]NIG57535.1 RagB/SusD family nutrient uptake outer membrane protein [Chitinophaga sp. Cy-1792]
MKKSIYTSALALLLLAGSGCRKFVEIDQPGTRPLKNTADFDALLNSSYNMTTTFSYPWAACDDIDVTDASVQGRITNVMKQAYIWADYIVGDDANDGDWDRIYKQVYVCNQIVDAVMTSIGGTDQQKRLILAKAKMFRAMAYMDLVNVYAKHYDPATAATDPGVPLVLRAAVEGVSLVRVPVKQVYEQITKDLLESVPDLQGMAGTTVEASQGAAFALLARENLYMANYADAARYADSALARNNKLIDLAAYPNGVGFPDKMSNPEMYLFRVIGSSNLVFYPMAADLQALFATNDLRWSIYTIDGKDFSVPFSGRAFRKYRLTIDGAFCGLDVPEVLLTKAEGLARTNQPQAAMDVVNTLRKKRFLAADYQPLTAADATSALKIVLEERRRELMGRGIRLFDQKRLNREPQFAKTVTRTLLGTTYVLEPNSNKYVFPIASKYVSLNPEIVQNPR